MNFQLVIQLPESGRSFNDLLRIEELLQNILIDDYEYDGHDIGSGTINFFIYTEKPEDCFSNIKTIFHKKSITDFKAAYWDTNSEDYIVLWPKTLKEFDIM